MRTTTAIWPGYELVIDRDGEFVYSDSPAPDERWRFVDEQGHGHFWSDGFPTLEWVVEPCTMGHGDDCTGEGHYECRLCRQEIRPGTRPADPLWVAGATTYTLKVQRDGQERTYRFGAEQWSALLDAVEQAVDSSLSDDFLTEVQHTSR